MPLGVQTNIVTTKPGQDFILPPANSNTGQTILVKNTSIVSDLLIRTSGKDQIDNTVSTYTLGALECVTFYSDGSAWWGISLLSASSGGTPPTGTGFRHVTAGVEDAASKLVDTADINPSQVTYAKIQNISAISKLLGRGSAAGVGSPEEITLGTNLSMSGTTLNAAAGAPGSTTFGTAILDFGAWPGSNVAYVDVVTAGVVSTSAIQASLRPVASTDHTDADHIVAPMKVSAVFVSNDNIRIYGINTNDVIPPPEQLPAWGKSGGTIERQRSPMFVGQFNVLWVWN